MTQLDKPAALRTFYFIGVTTTQSSIMKIFPKWAQALDLDAQIKGIDLPLHAPPESYRRVVEYIKNDPLSLGALVTTHKIDLLKAAHDLFDYLDPFASAFGEISCISKHQGALCGHAKDPISVGLSMESFLPPAHWQKTGAEICVLGAGGSGLAVSAYAAMEKHGDHVPAHIHITDQDPQRLRDAVRILHASRAPISFHLCAKPEANSYVAERLPEGSLVINATGLGKDAPGSPLPDGCRFPMNGMAWEFNYRGSLDFLRQAEAAKQERHLLVEDGWTYFIHGWTQVISEVFKTDIGTERLQLLSQIALGGG